MGIEIKTADHSRFIARLAPAETGGRTIQSPAQRCREERLVNWVEIQGRAVQKADLRRVVRVTDLGDSFKILIAVEADAGRTSCLVVGHERRRSHLRS